MKFQTGEKVRLTTAFLRNTGQFTGSEPQRKFTVLNCEDKGPSSMVTTDQEKDPEDMKHFTAAELAADPTLKYRRILAVNLERCRTW